MADLDAILIAGPTASGKSSLALSLAQKYGGVIVNADSMQVYDALPILTARPTPEDERRAPHRLYGTVSASSAYSVSQWAEDVERAIKETLVEKQLPIIVGGTGLYFHALLNGLSPIPDIPDAVRDFWRDQAKRKEAGALHEILRQKDPDMAQQLRPTDTQRIVRALEVLEASGQSLRHWQEISGTPILRFERVKALVVAPDRETLYLRCDARFEKMLANGALEEVRDFRALAERRGISTDLPIFKALGMRPLSAHLDGELSLDEACALAKRDTRRYAKRQMTWLRGNMIAWNWLLPQDMERIIRDLLSICDDCG